MNFPTGPGQGSETNTVGFYWEVGPTHWVKRQAHPVQYPEDGAPGTEQHNVGRPPAQPPTPTAVATIYSKTNSPVLSELQRIVSFFLPNGPCLIHTETVKGSLGLMETTPSGILTAWVPLNSKTWSLSWPLSVGRPEVQFQGPLGEGSSSAVPDAAPTTQWHLLCALGRT